MTTSKIGVTLDTTLLQRLDKDRGLVPRSRYLAKIIEDAYKEKAMEARTKR